MCPLSTWSRDWSQSGADIIRRALHSTEKPSNASQTSVSACSPVAITPISKPRISSVHLALTTTWKTCLKARVRARLADRSSFKRHRLSCTTLLSASVKEMNCAWHRRNFPQPLSNLLCQWGNPRQASRDISSRLKSRRQPELQAALRSQLALKVSKSDRIEDKQQKTFHVVKHKTNTNYVM